MTEPKYGYCPSCGSDWLKKNGTMITAIGRKQQYKCKSCSRKTFQPRPPSDPVPMRNKLPTARRYIVTAAQNATPVHERLWLSMLACAAHYDAEIVVIPGRYKNPTSTYTQSEQDHEWWAKEVLPYLAKGIFNLGDRLCIVGDVKVQWAASNPLASMETLTGERSGIIGHPRRELRSVATPQHKQPKMMFTTGCCTVPNYTDTKQGKIGQFHHCYGALMVEVAGDRYHVRQLNAMNNGSFIDLDMEFTPDGARDAKRPLSLVMGDTHWRWIDDDVRQATFGVNGIIAALKPQVIVWHDVLDQYARNHHHRGNWMVDYAKHMRGLDDVRQEIDGTLAFINDNTPSDSTSVIVSSNHDRALDKWLREEDFRKDPKNAELFLELAGMVAEALRNEKCADPFILYGRRVVNSNVRFLAPDESFMLAGVEHGLHGDQGPNGSRGTTRNLSKIGVKVTKGHSHSAEIVAGCYSVGKSTGRLEYEFGPSSHSNTHCILYANGKRSLITIINGKWRL